MTYNMTQLANADNVYKLMIFANESTNNILMMLFVLAFFFIMLMVMKKYEFEKSLLVSSWISFVVSILLVYAQMLPLIWALVFLIIAAFTSLYMMLSGGK